MATCPKCGARVTEAMSFCPNCGASLKAAAPVVQAAAPAPSPAPPYERREKGEKEEKGEKREKSEKDEKHEKQGGFTGLIIAGIVLIIVGVLFTIQMGFPAINSGMLWAVFFIVVGIVVILAYVLGVMRMPRRSPPT